MGERRSGRAITRAVVAVAIAVALAVFGRWIPALLLLAVVALVMVIPTLRTTMDRWASWLERHVGIVGMWATLGAFYLVVFAPAAVIRRLTRRSGFDSTLQGRSTWVDVSKSERSSPHRQFSGGAPEDRARRGSVRRAVLAPLVAIGAILVLIGVDLAAARVFPPRVSIYDTQTRSAAMRNTPWAKPYFAELAHVRQRFAPYVGWHQADLNGRYINVTGGVRRSYRTRIASDRPIDVYFFGGSTMWGVGQRDDRSIPSMVVRLAERDDIAIKAHNLGEIGYVMGQELAKFQAATSKGEVPDLAVFYNGVNEPIPQLQRPTDEPTHQNVPTIASKLERTESLRSLLATVVEYYRQHSLLVRLTRTPRRALSSSFSRLIGRDTDSDAREESSTTDAASLARRAVRLYERSVDLAARLAKSYEIDAYFFWQPTIYTKTIRPGEESLALHAATYASRDYASTLQAIHRAMPKLLHPPTIDITNALQTVSGPVMIDDTHTNEQGAAAIASVIYSHLRPQLLARAQAQSALEPAR